MKYTIDREYADPEKAARKLLEIANTVEAAQDGRIHIEKLNGPFLFKEGGTPAEYKAGLECHRARLALAARKRHLREIHSGWRRPICLKGLVMGPRKRRVDMHVVFQDNNWDVWVGELRRGAKSRAQPDHLFKYVAEKLPWASLDKVLGFLRKLGVDRQNVYMAHDSFGVARYGGRGRIFARLRSHKRKYPKELVYYPFYIIASKTHEREIENVILRAAGPQMVLNQRKVRVGIDPGGVIDYEPGTKFFRRKYARGTKPMKRRANRKPPSN